MAQRSTSEETTIPITSCRRLFDAASLALYTSCEEEPESGLLFGLRPPPAASPEAEPSSPVLLPAAGITLPPPPVLLCEEGGTGEAPVEADAGLPPVDDTAVGVGAGALNNLIH